MAHLASPRSTKASTEACLIAAVALLAVVAGMAGRDGGCTAVAQVVQPFSSCAILRSDGLPRMVTRCSDTQATNILPVYLVSSQFRTPVV